MAKSLRSKWKRKMKAQKRVRYGEKERARLEKMLKDFKESEGEKKKEEAEEHSPQVLGEQREGEVDTMDTSGHRPKHRAKSMRNEHGNYPVWMSQRKIQKQKEKKKKTEGKVNKRRKKKFL